MKPLKYDEQYNRLLIEQTLEGSQTAASQLVKLHQRFIYNLSLKLTRYEDNAADLCQEVLIRMLTRLSLFKFKSSFRTWLYRITMNHFLSQRRKNPDRLQPIDEMHDQFAEPDAPALKDHLTADFEMNKVRNKLLLAMSESLNSQQRIVLLLGAVFNVKSPVAAKLLNISPYNFRKQLSRTRATLRTYMNTPDINPEDNILREKNKQLDSLLNGKYARYFQNQVQTDEALAAAILKDAQIQRLFMI